MKEEIKAAFIDVETTGVNQYKNGLIQLSGTICTLAEHRIIEQEDFNYKIKPLPSDVIEDKALEINKVTRDQLEGFPHASQVYNSFTSMLNNYCDKFDRSDKLFFIGYNARFDYDFCRAWFEKLNDKYFGSYFFFPPIDVMNLAITQSIKERHLLENFKLGTVCNHFGINVDSESLHDADVDIKLTIELFKKLTYNN